MAVFYGRKQTSNICQCLVGLVLLMHTSAVHLSRQSVHQHQNMTSGFVTMGEFKFCKRSNNSYTSLATCKAGRSYAPEYKNPSMTALAVNIIIGLQWAVGLNQDWQSACLVTAEFKDQPCKCSHDHPPNPLDVFFGAFLKLAQHPVEAYMFLTYLQQDVYIRTNVMDNIIRRAVNQNHFDQVVFLGTGFDTRPYRRGVGMEKIQHIFETDLKVGMELKREVLHKCDITPINGKGQVKYVDLNLLEKEPFKELWHHQNFTGNGHTLIIAEQVFAYIDVFGNMNWIKQLRDTAIEAGGTAMLVLMATRGPNFDTSLFPRCYNQEECLLNQMPIQKGKSNTFMRALGWGKTEGYDDLEERYLNTRMSWQDSGYVGVFTAD